jgi:hypothetical protein
VQQLHTCLQIVPARGSAAFPITLYSTDPRTFSHKVEYILNGTHFQEFELNAEVLAVELQLSHTELDFAFSLDDWLPHVDRVLLLNNSNRFAAEFDIDNPCPGLFNVVPIAGSVPARSSAEVAIRWAPTDKEDALTSGTQLLNCCFCSLHATSVNEDYWLVPVNVLPVASVSVHCEEVDAAACVQRCKEWSCG